MNSIEKKAVEAGAIVAKLTLEEKASLCSGKDFWHTKGVERLGVQSYMLTDGPHGLRKQEGSGDHLGLNSSVPATCFPTASATACSFDTALLQEEGIALGEECRKHEVAVLLGPAANIKRNPLCGRNFEYISEDPLVAGELAAALINGVQSKNVGTSMKHYLANSQEYRRMVSDSVVDERTLRELYLPAFETAVKKAQPWTLMCSYNKINGIYASDNKRLMTDVPRGEWGYEGAIVTDWGAMNNRVEAVKAGLDLEMPSSSGHRDKEIVAAVNEGRLSMAELDAVATRMVQIALMNKDNKAEPYDVEEHNALARRIARESAVLLKNNGGLPASKQNRVAVIGEFAVKPRYQGAGSSRINPTKVTSVVDEFSARGVLFDYAQGYVSDSDVPNDALIAEAKKAAKDKETVFVFVGLPDSYESEGFDRTHLNLPAAHDRLVEAVAAVNSNVVAVVMAGSAVIMPWADKVASILYVGLTGQNNGGAVYDLVFGDYSPCGKLAETFPLQLSDVASTPYFAQDKYVVEYRESLYVGYRYFDKVGKDVAYPFGHGLSYTAFSYSNLELSKDEITDKDTLLVSVTVTNTGNIRAKEIVQLYVSAPQTTVFRPKKELRAFSKVMLEPGESRKVTMAISKRAFAYYNVSASDWQAESGIYGIEVGASSRDIRLTATVAVQDTSGYTAPNDKENLPAYYTLKQGNFEMDKQSFEQLLGSKVPEEPKDRPFHINSTMTQLRSCFIGRILYKIVRKEASKMLGMGSGENSISSDVNKMLSAMIDDMTLRSFSMAGDIMSPRRIEGLVTLLNGKVIAGLKLMLSKG